MNEKVKAFYGGVIEDPTKIVLTGKGNECPNCGNKFQALPPLVPNTTQKEFYGGRVKFFKDEVCKCGAKYRLCIERRYNSIQGADELHVIDMVVLEKGKTREEIVEDRIHQEFENGRIPSLEEREKLKDETVLATILDLDTKVDALCLHTALELQAMCQKEKIKFKDRDSKKVLAKKLLAKNPNLVTAE